MLHNTLLSLTIIFIITINSLQILAKPLSTVTEIFKCADGKKIIGESQVNDNYCDCVDGSDEPFTSACTNGKFKCKKSSIKGVELLPVSRIDDGICDCCDGSDEISSGVACRYWCPQQRGKRSIAIPKKKKNEILYKEEDFVNQHQQHRLDENITENDNILKWLHDEGASKLDEVLKNINVIVNETQDEIISPHIKQNSSSDIIEDTAIIPSAQSSTNLNSNPKTELKNMSEVMGLLPYYNFETNPTSPSKINLENKSKDQSNYAAYNEEIVLLSNSIPKQSTVINSTQNQNVSVSHNLLYTNTQFKNNYSGVGSLLNSNSETNSRYDTKHENDTKPKPSKINMNPDSFITEATEIINSTPYTNLSNGHQLETNTINDLTDQSIDKISDSNKDTQTVDQLDQLEDYTKFDKPPTERMSVKQIYEQSDQGKHQMINRNPAKIKPIVKNRSRSRQKFIVYGAMGQFEYLLNKEFFFTDPNYTHIQYIFRPFKNVVQINEKELTKYNCGIFLKWLKIPKYTHMTFTEGDVYDNRFKRQTVVSFICDKDKEEISNAVEYRNYLYWLTFRTPSVCGVIEPRPTLETIAGKSNSEFIYFGIFLLVCALYTAYYMVENRKKNN